MVFLDRRSRTKIGEMANDYWSTYKEEQLSLGLINVINTYNVGDNLCEEYLEEKTFSSHFLVFKVEESESPWSTTLQRLFQNLY